MPKGTDKRIIRAGNYEFNPHSRKLWLNDEFVVLTNIQAKILTYFINHPNRVIPREEIVTAVWGEYDYFKGRCMDVGITHIRKHIIPDQSMRILNKHGVGFSMVIKEPKPQNNIAE